MRVRAAAANVLREPLVHFLIAGALVFALFGPDGAPQDRRIVIDASQVERLSAEFAQTFRRPPTRTELDALIDNAVRDEVYYREALRLGLDQDDLVVRRRMRLKMEGFATTPVDLAAPSDRVLQDWLNRHPARFAGEPLYSFEQRFMGGSLPLPAALVAVPLDDVAAQFGEQFATALKRLPPGRWTPVASGFGEHQVRLTERRPAPPPRLAEIRQQVENDWRAAQAKASSERAYRALRDGYVVSVAR